MKDVFSGKEVSALMMSKKRKNVCLGFFACFLNSISCGFCFMMGKYFVVDLHVIWSYCF